MRTSTRPKLDPCRTAEGDLVAVLEATQCHPFTVDRGAVGGSKISEHETVTFRPDLGVLPADVGVIEGDRALGQPSECEAELAEHDLFARTQMQYPIRAITFFQTRIDPQLAGTHRVVTAQRDAHRTHELPTLLASGLTGGVSEFANQQFFNLCVPFEVDGGENDFENVGDDRLASDPNRTRIGHLASNPVTDLNGPDAPAEKPADGAVDKTLETTLQGSQTHS